MLERQTIAALLCIGLISGCSSPGEKRNPDFRFASESPTAIWSKNPESEALAWLAAYRALSNAALDEQRKEYQAAQAAASKDGSDSNRLRLALALSLPGVPWRDDSKLITTLESPTSLFKLPDSPLHQLVFMLYKQAQERQRLRDEQRKHESELLEDLKRLRDEQKRHEAELLEGQRRNDELQMKLDALRRIDQDLKQRKHGLESIP
jgi:hypothetical protein